MRAHEKNLPTGYLDAEKDMLAAIEYIKKQSKEKIILFGSSYSASLALKIAKDIPSVSAIVAFSPGEYFQPTIQLKTLLTKLEKPIFIASTKTEYPFIKEMMANVPKKLIQWWTPAKGTGIHGSRALWQTSEGNEDCWMSLLMFFKGLKK
jgi:hypothetical protein